jgi:thiol-disulfide isomerase/thioredoxin
MIDNHQLRHYVEAMIGRRKSFLGYLALAILLSLAMVSSGAGAGKTTDANHSNPGQPLDVKRLLVRGKTTLIDFHSPFCPPCVHLAPIIAKLAATRSDLAVKKVNINRPEVKGIDWHSPLAQQYQLRQVPYFMIFDPQGKLVAQGRDAAGMVQGWLKEAGLME